MLERESDMTVVAEAADGRESVRLAETEAPDVVVMDLAMPNMNGMEATRRILAANSRVGVVILSMHQEAISLLLSMIEQHGDDPAVGKNAADIVKAIGSPEQVEAAYAALASHFPADASVWLRLGDARFAAEQDIPALDAWSNYLNVLKMQPDVPRGRKRVAALWGLT
jgi:CheY-like chemotaxis protein